MYGRGERGRERESEGKELLEGWKRGKGRFGYAKNGRRKGEAGGIGLYWERYRRSPQSSNSHGKKKRGGGKVDGLSAGGYGRWPEPRQKRKPIGWLVKRRGVTVTADDGLNPIREAQDESVQNPAA